MASMAAESLVVFVDRARDRNSSPAIVIRDAKTEIAAPPGADKEKRQFEEFGDLMFVIVNLGLHLGIDAESALRAANRKFVGRMESMVAQAKAGGKEFGRMTLDEMNVLWDRAKEVERSRED